MLTTKHSYAGFDDVVATRTNYNGDGRKHPNTSAIRDVGTALEVWDVTGWDGLKEVPNFLVCRIEKAGLAPSACEHLAITAAEEIACCALDPRQIRALKRHHDFLASELENYKDVMERIKIWWETAHPTIPFSIDHITLR